MKLRPHFRANSVSPPLRLALLPGALAAVLSSGCVADAGDEDVLAGEAAASLGAPPAGGYAFARDADENRKSVPVERNGKWQVVYSVPVDALSPAERVAVRGEVQLTVCQASDIEPSSPCRRISPFAPTFKVKVVLGTSPNDSDGQALSDVRDVTCTHLRHHCALAVDEVVTGKLKGSRFVNLVVSAVDGNATSADVMIVDDHHGGLYVTRMGKDADVQGTDFAGKDVSPPSMKLDMENKNPREAHVTLQAKLTGARPGDVLGIEALIEARTRGGGAKPAGCSGARDPLMSHQLVVSTHANDPIGSRLTAASAKNGSNCAIGDTCGYRKSAGVELPKNTPDTIYVSVVSWGGRSCSAPGDEWSLGGASTLRVTRRRAK